MKKRQKEIEKSSAAVVNAERAAVLKVLKELGYGLTAKTLTNQVLVKFGERNVEKLFPGSYVLGHKKADDIYATFKGLYARNNEINWNMATNRVGGRTPNTKTVSGFKRYLPDEDTRRDSTDEEDDAPTHAASRTTTTSTQAYQWGKTYVTAPPMSDNEGGDTDEDEE